MHGAPAVRCPVGRTRGLAAALVAGWLAGAAAFSLYLAQTPASGWRTAVLVVAVGLAAIGGFTFWRGLPTGALRWSGTDWHWRADGALDELPVVVVSRFDLQRALLLEVTAEGERPLWLWLSHSLAPTMWDDTRRAVYSPAGSAPQGTATGAPNLS